MASMSLRRGHPSGGQTGRSTAERVPPVVEKGGGSPPDILTPPRVRFQAPAPGPMIPGPSGGSAWPGALHARNLLSARSKPATHRRRMSPSRHRVTRAVTRRVAESALSIGPVVASARRSTPGTPDFATVSVSSGPSRGQQGLQLGAEADPPRRLRLLPGLLPAPGDDRVLVEPDVRPAEPEDLAAAHPRVGRDRAEEMRVILRRLGPHQGQEPADLLGRRVRALPEVGRLPVPEPAPGRDRLDRVDRSEGPLVGFPLDRRRARGRRGGPVTLGDRPLEQLDEGESLLGDDVRRPRREPALEVSLQVAVGDPVARRVGPRPEGPGEVADVDPLRRDVGVGELLVDEGADGGGRPARASPR